MLVASSRRPRLATTAFVLFGLIGSVDVARAEDDFTLYELLDPASHQFAITYDTTTSGGRGYYFNGIREGSEATDERVMNRGTGQELEFEVIDGVRGKEIGMPDRVSDDAHFIMVPLADMGDDAEMRLRIFKTYRDAESYWSEGDTIIFERSLGIRANAVVLPNGYELIESSIPVIVTTESDGRVKVSMLNDRDDALQVRLVGRQLAATPGGAR
ncbi:MAG: hypothetical protein GKS06_07605 [Acidobacteria bacterium]|nr:hypothetical protein [Acidobacteriota bacterium]